MNPLTKKIIALKRKKNAVILAHYYQRPEIQEVADFVGDSLKLAQEAAKTQASLIVFAGVHFMAETAKILNPEKKVVLPDIHAGCSLSDACPPDKFRRFIKNYPGHVVVSYINCSAAVKALSDICCTSSNAIKVIQSVPKGKKIVFAPDKNLGKYLREKTKRDLVLWDGVCMVHTEFSIEKLIALLQKHPKAKIIAHPESEEHILKMAFFIGSTAQLLHYVRNDMAEEYLVGTEAGILYQMQKWCPKKKFFPIPVYEDNYCACSECAYMKMNTLEKLYSCMRHEKPEIVIPEKIRTRAEKAVKKMLEISNG